MDNKKLKKHPGVHLQVRHVGTERSRELCCFHSDRFSDI